LIAKIDARDAYGSVPYKQLEDILRRSRVLVGRHGPVGNSLVVFMFPSKQAARDWHNSARYQQLLPLRRQAADMTLLMVPSF